MSGGGDRFGGLLDSLRAVVGTGLDFVHTRVRLIGVELEQELLRARTLIILSILAVLLTCLAAGFIGIALIVVFWDSHREIVAVSVAGAFTLAAAVAIIVLKRSARARPRPFASIIEVLEQDSDALRRNT